MANDFYAVLALAQDAKRADIKTRFRELARTRHPDRFSGEEKVTAETEFQSITEAFNVLMDPMRRRQHDLELQQVDRPRFDPPDVIKAYMARGVRAYKEGNFLEAAGNFDSATQEAPSNPKTWYHLALTCIRETRWLPKAQIAIEKACQLRKGHVPYLKLGGQIFARSGMTARAKQYYNQALASGGPDASIQSALNALAEAKEQAKDESGRIGKIWK